MKKLAWILVFSFVSLAVDAHDEPRSIASTDRGVLESSEKKGIKLSPEAEKNFGLEKIALTGSPPWSLPAKAVLSSLDETSIYRWNDGFYQRILVSVTDQKKDSVKVQAKELATGDQIVIAGVGFLRITEVSAFEGVPDEH